VKVLVTGSEGYIGSVLTPMLKDRGHRVTRLDSLLFAACAFGRVDDMADVIRKDIRDVAQSDLAGHDAIIHLAGLSNDPLSDLAPDLTMQINHTAAVNLARMARDAGVPRFVFSSTCSVYGFQGDDFITENNPVNPLTPYANSKVLAERDLDQLRSSSFVTVSLRHGTAYGYSPMIRFDLVVNNLVAWAHTTGKILLKSDGSAWRPMVHVDDICRSFVAALEADESAISGEVFNIGRTADNIRIRDLAHLIARKMPGCKMEFMDGATADKRSYRVDCSKALGSLPGFDAQVSLESGVQQVIDKVTQSDIAGLQFENDRYGRIAHLRHCLANGSIDTQLRVSV